MAGLVLAAGAGSRLRRPKATVRLRGATLLARAVGALRAAGCDPVLAVVGAAGEEAAAEAGRAGARPVANPDWASGLGSSLRVGLEAVPPGCAAVAVLLVDQPLVGAEAVRRVVAAHRADLAGADRRPAARATYGGVPGHPVVLGRVVLRELAAGLSGDSGAREWLRANAHLVVPVPCDGIGDPVDVGTPEALRAVAERLGSTFEGEREGETSWRG